MTEAPAECSETIYLPEDLLNQLPPHVRHMFEDGSSSSDVLNDEDDGWSCAINISYPSPDDGSVKARGGIACVDDVDVISHTAVGVLLKRGSRQTGTRLPLALSRWLRGKMAGHFLALSKARGVSWARRSTLVATER